MKKRFREEYEADETLSWAVAHRYREVILDESKGEDVHLGLIHYRGGEVEFQLGKQYSFSDDAGDRATGADILENKDRVHWSTTSCVLEHIGFMRLPSSLCGRTLP